ncbi:MAG: sigma-70 family RNA polymerase sigma factor [Chloroflexi bacterium]|nr:MAG: sigma-70 family RNA polymerase sigma factor [Chloroflexota bacterium]
MTTIAVEAPETFVFQPQTLVRNWGMAVRDTLQKVKAGIGTKPETLSDEELMAAICGGSEFALELLYERYHRYAFSLAYRILQDPVAAEDIVQEAFLALWRKADTYQQQHGSVHSWLQAIVHHRAIDKIRASAHRDQQCISLQAGRDKSDSYEQDPASAEPELWEQAWHDEQSRLIRAALDQIPPEQRQVIELAYFGGYTHAEISEQWNIPLGTVKGRMRLGMQKLKLLLQEDGIDML